MLSGEPMLRGEPMLGGKPMPVVSPHTSQPIGSRYGRRWCCQPREIRAVGKRSLKMGSEVVEAQTDNDFEYEGRDGDTDAAPIGAPGITLGHIATKVCSAGH